ncbi:putative F-box protein [Capsicum annuum]|uniref:putative F-box protein At1g67623 n=1 Tax=Capsicum annuum TaxID=4072 RepID=UPI0007BECB04|nr:putative F-box protein At1g67623 [Capsicum annuum]
MMMNRYSRKNMKRRGSKRTNKVIKENFCSSIESLPNELLTDIVARVASRSFKNFINVKLSCKVFDELANERYVYQKATLVDFPIAPWEKQTQEKISKVNSFMELCRECENTEALYRKGVLDYFKDDEAEVALEFLKRAENGGHVGAWYVIGIIMVFMGGEYKRKGVTLIGNMKETEKKLTRACRKSLIEILTEIWVTNPSVLEQRRPTGCNINNAVARMSGLVTLRMKMMDTPIFIVMLVVVTLKLLIYGNV